jgi:citrate lyase subunit beta / citryl-CoA lyase
MAVDSWQEQRLRSLLFVPANRPDRVEKAWRAGADAVILDLEDSIPEAAKSASAKTIKTLLSTRPNHGPLALARINAVSSRYWSNDIEELQYQGLSGLVLPQCNAVEEVLEVGSALAIKERENNLDTGTVRLFLLIESARGVLQADQLAKASSRVAALVFGAEDFCLDMRISHTPEGSELAFARASIALCARAHGLPAIDTVFTNVRDTAGLIHDSQVGKRTGFSGKLAIHPKQIDVIHSVFAASREELELATKIVETYKNAEAKGYGAVSLDGKMIDRPIYERARRLLRSANIPE